MIYFHTFDVEFVLGVVVGWLGITCVMFDLWIEAAFCGKGFMTMYFRWYRGLGLW